MIYFKNTVSPENDKVIFFQALDGEESIGRCTLILEEKYANITELTFSDVFAGEGLLKSAFNYACLRNYYMGRCTAENADKLLIKAGFQKVNGVYENDIPTILMGSCASCNK